MSEVWDRLEAAATREWDRESFEASLDDDTLLDCHTHTPPEYRGYADFHDWVGDETYLSPDQLVSWMDEAGVDRSVLLPLETTATRSYIPTWLVLKYAERFPDRLIPFCCVDPAIVEMDGEAWVSRIVEEYVSRGARGFGEVRVRLPIDHERMQLLYRICSEHDLPILIHTETGFADDDVGLPGLERMLQQYPHLDFIMHHYAWWAHISGDVTADDLDGYPTGPVEPGGRVPALLSSYDNVYAEISSPAGYHALTRDPTYGQTFLEQYHERVIFGTDKMVLEQPIAHFSLFDTFELSPAAWKNIRYRNLERIMR